MCKKITLVSNWRQAPRWLSVKCMAAAGALQGGWLMLDAEQRASLPAGTATYVTLALLALGVAGRLVDQGGKDDRSTDQ